MSEPPSALDVAPAQTRRAFLVKGGKALAVLCGLYVLLVLLLVTPFFQAHMIYLHAIRYPFFARYDIPEKYDLAPGKTVNLQIHTTDNVTLGAWFIFADQYYLSSPSTPDSGDPVDHRKHISSAVRARSTILFLHGNAATRAAPLRISHYHGFTSRAGTNVFAIDFRGFGDSAGSPSPDGLARDAQAAWSWLIDAGADPEDVLIVGHSLGTAVAARLGAELGRQGVPCRGVVLLAPFTSLRALLDTYALLGVIPLAGPLSFIPGGSEFITWSLVHRFDTLGLISDINATMLLVHAEDDWEIPSAHSEILFDALLQPLLPTTDERLTKHEVNLAMRGELVTRTLLPNFGSLETFNRSSDGRSKVILLKTLQGGHNTVGTMEGVQFILRKTFHSCCSARSLVPPSPSST